MAKGRALKPVSRAARRRQLLFTDCGDVEEQRKRDEPTNDHRGDEQRADRLVAGRLKGHQAANPCNLSSLLLYINTMTPRPKAKYPKATIVAVRLSDEMNGQLREIQDRDGVPISEQIRRGIRLWVTKTERKRAVTRKRS